MVVEFRGWFNEKNDASYAARIVQLCQPLGTIDQGRQLLHIETLLHAGVTASGFAMELGASSNNIGSSHSLKCL